MTYYNQEDLRILEEEEKLLRFSSFSSSDALKLGNAIAKAAENNDRGISIQIVRESDHLAIFQYVMDDKKERNLKFGEMKRDSVLKYGHSSAWVFVASQIQGTNVPSNERTSGGAFPICLKDGTQTATVMVSGLHEGKDHEVVLAGLEEVLSITVPRLLKEIA